MDLDLLSVDSKAVTRRFVIISDDHNEHRRVPARLHVTAKRPLGNAQAGPACDEPKPHGMLFRGGQWAGMSFFRCLVVRVLD